MARKNTEDNQEEIQCPQGAKCQKKTKKNQRQRTDRYDDYDDYDETDNGFLRPSDENFPMPPEINIEDHIIKPGSSTKRPAVSKKTRCLCAEVHRPVCGSNHKTYSNLCLFHCASKKYRSLVLAHWGVCAIPDENKKMKCKCTEVHRPVCSNTQTTYPNLCALHCDILKDNRIAFYFWGICPDRPSTPTRKRKPFIGRHLQSR